jgi:hypothetical protein
MDIMNAKAQNGTLIRNGYNVKTNTCCIETASKEIPKPGINNTVQSICIKVVIIKAIITTTNLLRYTFNFCTGYDSVLAHVEFLYSILFTLAIINTIKKFKMYFKICRFMPNIVSNLIA